MKQEDTYEFGYPVECKKCHNLCATSIHLQVKPYFHSTQETSPRLMLIGQDPTISKYPERVRHALMLDDKNGQLFRWLVGILGRENFDSMTIYGTNVVKCTFDKPPSLQKDGGYKFLTPFFARCNAYILEELKCFRPDFVMTFGEPTHKLFRSVLEDPTAVPESMQSAFTGKFQNVKCRGLEFLYTPCLHIRTYRVAITYGETVREFNQALINALKSK